MSTPLNYKRLIEFKNAKTIKGESLGYLTGILYLAPARESGIVNLCPKASAGCRLGCLFTAGRGVLQNIRDSRIAKTAFMVNHPDDFLQSLRYDVRMVIRRAKKHGLRPAVRLNGTSDLPKLAMQMAREFPDTIFYDYTKIPKPWQRTLPNYYLTFSRSENNERDCLEALEHGINVAVVFDTKTKTQWADAEPLPAMWNGCRVIDGDLHDLRFLDPDGVVVGLRAKGRAKRMRQTRGFVVHANNLVQLAAAAAA